MSISIVGSGLTKRYAGRAVFSGLSLKIDAGKITALLGPNGSGKSTLLKILARVLEPTKGTCEWMREGEVLRSVSPERLRGFVAPYLELYDELTALEHLSFVSNVRGLHYDKQKGVEILTQFGLAPEVIERGTLLRTFSSGMRQRVRFGMAACGDPEILFLDEPTSNLDASGIAMLFDYLHARSRAGATIVLATNEPREREIADAAIELGSN